LAYKHANFRQTWSIAGCPISAFPATNDKLVAKPRRVLEPLPASVLLVAS
jgi:hypothetical protein